jgi:hypothetical protein
VPQHSALDPHALPGGLQHRFPTCPTIVLQIMLPQHCAPDEHELRAGKQHRLPV